MCRRFWSLAANRRKLSSSRGSGATTVSPDTARALSAPRPSRWGRPARGQTPPCGGDSVDALADAIDEIGPERVAAFFCEPIIGAGGVLLPPDGYLAGVQQVCRDRDVLFLVDEVICGFGRVGDWFASRRLGLQPDLLTFAKGVTSGYVPLGGVVVGARVRDAFWAEGAGVWRHGYTYSGHAVATAAAHANLDIMESEAILIARSRWRAT